MYSVAFTAAMYHSHRPLTPPNAHSPGTTFTGNVWVQLGRKSHSGVHECVLEVVVTGLVAGRMMLQAVYECMYRNHSARHIDEHVSRPMGAPVAYRHVVPPYTSAGSVLGFLQCRCVIDGKQYASPA